jgi:ABC-2 type transport system ATP-binding protein
VVVTVRGMRVAYGKFVVLEDVDLTVAEGEIVAVTGVNGAGKSTLLRCLAGLRRPAAGSVSVLGGPPRDDAGFWRAVALVTDLPTWYPGLTVREHLELVQLTHQPLAGWCLPAAELIEVFGLPSRADAMPMDLSSGQRQRLSLAAALARPSRLLLLDEPEQSLDAGFRRVLAGLLRTGYAAHGGTVVMATHDFDFADAAQARRVVLSDGQVVAVLWLFLAAWRPPGSRRRGRSSAGGGAGTGTTGTSSASAWCWRASCWAISSTRRSPG